MWILTTEKLPLEEYRGQRVIHEVLVTVELNETDPNDSPEVMILWFRALDMTFGLNISGPAYEIENSSWHVTAWMEKPNPYKK